MNVEQPPVEYTKVRMAEIGQAWKAYAKTQFELAKEKTPAQLKSWLKLDRKAPDAGSENETTAT